MTYLPLLIINFLNTSNLKSNVAVSLTQGINIYSITYIHIHQQNPTPSFRKAATPLSRKNNFATTQQVYQEIFFNSPIIKFIILKVKDL